MKTDTIEIYSDMKGRVEAMQEAERFASYNGLTGKDAMHIRLLAEETISMVHGIIHAFRGDFWMESETRGKRLLCRICVAADVDVDERQEDALLGLATSGRNEEAKGIMGKIRQIFRWALQANEGVYDQDSSVDMWYAMGASRNSIMYGASTYWSLQQYRRSLEEKKKTADAEEWDELEKSIVAKLADEVKVGLLSEKAVVVIEKSFPLV